MTTGVSRPEGRGAPGLVPEGVRTSSDRQTPRPGTTLDELAQVAATQLPLRKTWLVLEQAKQFPGPEAEQLEQLASQGWHVDDVLSKNWVWLQVGRQRPLVNTGRFVLQDKHWLNEAPEQLPQSGWQERQALEELNVLTGQEETHFPLEASWLFVQVKQNVADPAQVPHEESHAGKLEMIRGDISCDIPGGLTETCQVILRREESTGRTAGDAFPLGKHESW
jgi:hypothetical protein